MVSPSLKKKQLGSLQELTSESMMHTCLMTIAMEELLQPTQASLHSVDENKEAKSGGDDAVEVFDVKAGIDVQDEQTQLKARKSRASPSHAEVLESESRQWAYLIGVLGFWSFREMDIELRGNVGPFMILGSSCVLCSLHPVADQSLVIYRPLIAEISVQL
ncbi:hypothetical protein L7F22_042706 [Adiantum nelumboides]|nr:hypothetical protein [Adiantum nelumboides]